MFMNVVLPSSDMFQKGLITVPILVPVTHGGVYSAILKECPWKRNFQRKANLFALYNFMGVNNLIICPYMF